MLEKSWKVKGNFQIYCWIVNNKLCYLTAQALTYLETLVVFTWLMAGVKNFQYQ